MGSLSSKTLERISRLIVAALLPDDPGLEGFHHRPTTLFLSHPKSEPADGHTRSLSYPAAASGGEPLTGIGEHIEQRDLAVTAKYVRARSGRLGRNPAFGA